MTKTTTILHGDCRERMAEMETESVDAIVCDPPYGLEFMGKGWDRLSDDAVSKSWDTKGRTMTQAPDVSRFKGGVARGVIAPKPNPRCDNCGRAINGKNTAKGFKVCQCEKPAPRLPNTYAVKMQSWHQTWAEEAYRVLKPGGHLLAFSGTRTSHRMVCAIEDAGFEIRDSLSWLYGSGFPKSHDVSKAIDKAAGAEREVVGRATLKGNAAVSTKEKGGTYIAGASLTGVKDIDITTPATDLAQQWEGWGTALKPAHEPICMARKPLVGTVAANVTEYGAGALNIDGCRIPITDAVRFDAKQRRNNIGGNGYEPGVSGQTVETDIHTYKESGRWPANLILDEDAASMLDEQSGVRAAGNHPAKRSAGTAVYHGWPNGTRGERIPTDTGGASRFFYVAKASRKERNAGLEMRNIHPTVKPIALMRWLVRLVTPPGGVVLDPFMGSGTTGCAAAMEGFEFVGIEQDAEYIEIAERRIAHWQAQSESAKAEPEQLSLNDPG